MNDARTIQMEALDLEKPIAFLSLVSVFGI
jgi:hypothetical protein